LLQPLKINKKTADTINERFIF